MKASRAGHLETVQFLVEKGKLRFTDNNLLIHSSNVIYYRR